MIEIMKNLYIGTRQDYEREKNKEYSFVNACKEQHKEYLGYSGWKAPIDKNYLYVEQEHRLICNLIDARDMKYIPKEIIDKCLEFVDKELKNGRKVLINCQEGHSRSATIGLLYMLKKGLIKGNFDEIYKTYLQIYPPFMPSKGMYEYLQSYVEMI